MVQMIDKLKQKDLKGSKTKFIKGKSVTVDLRTTKAERILMDKINEVIIEVNKL